MTQRNSDTAEQRHSGKWNRGAVAQLNSRTGAQGHRGTVAQRNSDTADQRHSRTEAQWQVEQRYSGSVQQ